MATLSDETKVASVNRQDTAAEWARSQEERDAASKERIAANAERKARPEWRVHTHEKLDEIAHHFLLGKRSLSKAQHKSMYYP